MSLGQGIAVAGIWLGAGLIGWHDGGAGMVATMCAMVATMFVADAGR